eukprot:237259-Chlamydomonas_euryale.AAC.8
MCCAAAHALIVPGVLSLSPPPRLSPEPPPGDPHAHRQHPLLLAPDARTVRPARGADALGEDLAPVLGAVLRQRLHIMMHVEQAAVLRAVDHLVERVGLAACGATLNVLERHELGGEWLRQTLVQRRCRAAGRRVARVRTRPRCRVARRSSQRLHGNGGGADGVGVGQPLPPSCPEPGFMTMGQRKTPTQPTAAAPARTSQNASPRRRGPWCVPLSLLPQYVHLHPAFQHGGERTPVVRFLSDVRACGRCLLYTSPSPRDAHES